MLDTWSARFDVKAGRWTWSALVLLKNPHCERSCFEDCFCLHINGVAEPLRVGERHSAGSDRHRRSVSYSLSVRQPGPRGAKRISSGIFRRRSELQSLNPSGTKKPQSQIEPLLVLQRLPSTSIRELVVVDRDLSVREYEIETARKLMRLGVGRSILNPRRIEDDEIGDHGPRRSEHHTFDLQPCAAGGHSSGSQDLE